VILCCYLGKLGVGTTNFSSYSRTHLPQKPSIIFLHKVRALFSHGICARHDVARYMAWEDRGINHTETFDAFDSKAVVDNLGNA
jgi:hypothetical protein